jgi:hypothetical protein
LLSCFILNYLEAGWQIQHPNSATVPVQLDGDIPEGGYIMVIVVQFLHHCEGYICVMNADGSNQQRLTNAGDVLSRFLYKLFLRGKV